MPRKTGNNLVLQYRLVRTSKALSEKVVDFVLALVGLRRCRCRFCRKPAQCSAQGRAADLGQLEGSAGGHRVRVSLEQFSQNADDVNSLKYGRLI